MWPLHRLNQLRVPYVRAQVRKQIAGSGPTLEDLCILDIGCSAGLVGEAMVRVGARVTLVNPAKHGIRTARAHASIADGFEIRRYHK